MCFMLYKTRLTKCVLVTKKIVILAPGALYFKIILLIEEKVNNYYKKYTLRKLSPRKRVLYERTSA